MLDTSVVIGFLQQGDPHHDAARGAVRQASADELVVPSVAYAEVMVGAFLAGAAAVEPIEGFFDELARRVEPLTRDIARRAAALRAAERGLALPDALIVATAEALDAERLLTADSRLARLSPRVAVIGP